MAVTNGASSAGGAKERFLRRVVDEALEHGWRTAPEFLRAFPPAVLVESLPAELRTRLLVEGAKIPAKIAVRHSAAAAREDLEIALDEGLTTAQSLCALIPGEARARHLDAGRLWAFATGGEWLGRAALDEDSRRRAVERIRNIVRFAAAEGLVEEGATLSSIAPSELAARASVPALRRAFALAVESAERGEVLDKEELYDLVGAAQVLEALPPDQLWAEVVLVKIVGPLSLDRLGPQRSAPTSTPLPAPNGAATRSAPPPPSSAAKGSLPPPPAAPKSALPAPPRPPSLTARSATASPLPPVRAPLGSAGEDDEPRSRRGGVPRPAPRPRAPLVSEVELSEDDLEVERTDPGALAAVAAASDGGRRRAVVDRLTGLGRLPPNHEYLSLAILRAIAKMYEELPSHRGKSGRAQCIRGCFDNDAHLRTGMLALLELLDPDTGHAHGDADGTTLVDALLMAEKSIWQRAKGRRSIPPPPEDMTLPARRAIHVKAHAPPPSAMPLTRVKR